MFYKAAYISNVLTKLKWEIKCTILGSKDAKVKGERLFTELTCFLHIKIFTCCQESWKTFARERITTIKMLILFPSVQNA